MPTTIAPVRPLPNQTFLSGFFAVHRKLREHAPATEEARRLSDECIRELLAVGAVLCWCRSASATMALIASMACSPRGAAGGVGKMARANNLAAAAAKVSVQVGLAWTLMPLPCCWRRLLRTSEAVEPPSLVIRTLRNHAHCNEVAGGGARYLDGNERHRRLAISSRSSAPGATCIWGPAM